LSGPEVVVGDVDTNEGESGSQRKVGRRVHWVLLLLLLLLLIGSAAVMAQLITRGPDQARFIARNLECLQCHTQLIPDLGKPSVHSPFMLKECTVCHTPHGVELERTIIYGGFSNALDRAQTVIEWLPLNWVLGFWDSVTGTERAEREPGEQGEVTKKVVETESRLVAPVEELCWTCHGDIGVKVDDRHQHRPFELADCMDCHEPHASDYRDLLVQHERDLCITCHQVGTEMARDQTHPPFARRHCLDCHDPHASPWEGILITRQTDLCFMCHPSVAPLSLLPVQHQPFAYDNCMGCHEPHGSNYRPLLLKPEPDICYDCHPYIEDDFRKASIHPVGTSELNCADCHDAHAANYAGLLIAEDNELCYECHATAIEARYEASAHRDTLCVECHTPHGSNYAPILLDQNPDVCLRCHDPRHYDESSPTVRRNNHPVRPVHFDVNNRSPLTCTSTCHDPHGTDNTAMLRYMDAQYDGNCLICHAVVAGERGGIDF